MSIITFPTYVSRTCAVLLTCATEQIVCCTSLKALCGCTNIAFQHLCSLYEDLKPKRTPFAQNVDFLAGCFKKIAACADTYANLRKSNDVLSKSSTTDPKIWKFKRRELQQHYFVKGFLIHTPKICLSNLPTSSS